MNIGWCGCRLLHAVFDCVYTFLLVLQGDKIVTVVGKVTNDSRLEEIPAGIKVCALNFTTTARARIEGAGGECLTFDQLALREPKGDNCVSEGPRGNARGLMMP